MLKEVEKSEKAIKDRVGIGMSVPERALVNQLTQQGLNESAVRKVTHSCPQPRAPTLVSLGAAIASTCKTDRLCANSF